MNATISAFEKPQMLEVFAAWGAGKISDVSATDLAARIVCFS